MTPEINGFYGAYYPNSRPTDKAMILMLALVAASYHQDITLTIAMSPSDFIMEGFYRDNKDGMHFVFPESLLNIMLPGLGNLMPLIFSAGRKYPRACKAVRVDIDNKLSGIIREW